MNLKRYLAVFLLFLSAITCASIEAIEHIRSKGSRTLGNIAQIWAENYQRLNSDVEITVVRSSSGAGIAMLINGSIEIVNSSQPLSEREIKLAARYGRNPRAHVVGYDALALYVHKANPLRSLSIPDLAQIFAKDGKTTHWTDLGLEFPTCKQRKIMLFGRHITSGSHNFFRSSVLGKELYNPDVLNMLSPKEVVDQVAENPCAIGYGSHTYAHQHVKMVCVSIDQGGACIKPNVETIVDNSYPIIRPLYMYTNGKPKAGIQAYLDWILSAEGQCIALNEGFAPVRSVTCP